MPMHHAVKIILDKQSCILHHLMNISVYIEHITAVCRYGTLLILHLFAALCIHAQRSICWCDVSAHLSVCLSHWCVVSKLQSTLHCIPLTLVVMNRIWNRYFFREFCFKILALHGTDGRLFTTDVSVNFKVTWHEKWANIRNPARPNLDVVPYSLRIRGHLLVAIVNGEEDNFWKRSDFQIWRALDLDFDLGSRHTAYRVHHSSTSTYMPNFIEIEETFYGRTHVLTYARTYVRIRTYGRLTVWDRLY